MERNVKPFKWKKWLKFRHIYALVLLAITALLVWHIVNLLILTPMRETGEVMHGSRMDNIQELEDSWRSETESFGATLDDVDYVTVFPPTGPVIYISVRVEPGTSRRYARRASRAVVEHFIEVSDEVALQYNIQIVVSYGDIVEMRAEHHAEVERHVHMYNYGLVEEILAHAELYPSETNVSRAETNITVFSNSIIAVGGDERLEEMRARVGALDGGVAEALEEEDFEPMPHFPADTREIPSSSISRFPIWGTWNNERARIVWSP